MSCPRPDAIANWDAFFQGLGDRVVDRGKPASETAEVGHCGAGTRLGGYSLISAEDLQSAVALAKGCPALAEGPASRSACSGTRRRPAERPQVTGPAPAGPVTGSGARRRADHRA
jgi:hypothetical protein